MLRCSYCGQIVEKTENEHVFPANIYPESKRGSKVQRLTIKAWRQCNGSQSDDEAHFRNVLSMAGENLNKPRQELWEGQLIVALINLMESRGLMMRSILHG